ncbi:helix-turn-helix domain-containing protein [Desulforegula conservatrix]|uniref:helix-turn-helix domain-containing protein n=1 Tax=Desulforegula conservatrix TaxID=153026 RepID=UPI00041CE108
MKHGYQTQIAKKAGVSDAFISFFFKGKKIPSWKTAKKLGAATDTDPILWAEGRFEEIKTVLSSKENKL